MMEPIVPIGLSVLVGGGIQTLELIPFAVRNTNPKCCIVTLPDIFHYSSDIVEGKCWICKERNYSVRHVQHNISHSASFHGFIDRLANMKIRNTNISIKCLVAGM